MHAQFWLGGMPIVVVSSPDVARKVLLRELARPDMAFLVGYWEEPQCALDMLWISWVEPKFVPSRNVCCQLMKKSLPTFSCSASSW